MGDGEATVAGGFQGRHDRLVGNLPDREPLESEERFSTASSFLP